MMLLRFWGQSLRQTRQDEALMDAPRDGGRVAWRWRESGDGVRLAQQWRSNNVSDSEAIGGSVT